MTDRLTRVYLFIGPPGSGKGTLSHLCSGDLGWIQLSTGNLCRMHIAEQTEIGKQIDFAIKSGKLVSDSLISSMVEQWFTQVVATEKDIVLDGYPRTLIQAETFDRFVKEHNFPIRIQVIHFVISDDMVIRRIGGRLVCLNKSCQKVYSALEKSALSSQEFMVCDVCQSPLGKRSDDEVSAIRERLTTYHKHEQELMEFYKKKKYPIIELIAEQPLDVVFSQFKELVGYSEA